MKACAVGGCRRRVKGKGMCHTHYMQVYRAMHRPVATTRNDKTLEAMLEKADQLESMAKILRDAAKILAAGFS